MDQSSRLVALLPFKRNSTRVPNKNFREMRSKPLYCWVLEALINSKLVDQIVINTDALDLIADNPLISHEKVTLIERHESLIGDEVSMNRIIKSDLNCIDGDHFLMTHVTNPLVRSTTFDRAIQKFRLNWQNGQFDSLFSVNKMQERLYTEQGHPINHDPEVLIPTQCLAPMYKENSNIYIFTRQSFMNTKARIGQRPFLFEMDEAESIDIDNQQDWLIAEALITHRELHV
ncbi:MAG: acylneuraminate cytidylyltransferase family protein [Paracoccaceae bacterium]